MRPLDDDEVGFSVDATAPPADVAEATLERLELDANAAGPVDPPA